MSGCNTRDLRLSGLFGPGLDLGAGRAILALNLSEF